MIAYQVIYHKKVEKFLDKQSDAFVRTFYEKVKILSENPRTTLLDIKPLEGVKGMKRRLRI